MFLCYNKWDGKKYFVIKSNTFVAEMRDKRKMIHCHFASKSSIRSGGLIVIY